MYIVDIDLTGQKRYVQIFNSGLAELIDAHVISDEFGARKPSPEIFVHISERIAIDRAVPGSSAMTPDRIYGVQGKSAFKRVGSNGIYPGRKTWYRATTHE